MLVPRVSAYYAEGVELIGPEVEWSRIHIFEARSLLLNYEYYVTPILAIGDLG